MRTIPSRSVSALEPPGDLANAGDSRPIRGEVVGPQLAVDEELDQRRIAIDDPAKGRVGEVVRRHRHERAGGHADQHEHDAEDECEEHRPAPIATCDSRAQHVRGP